MMTNLRDTTAGGMEATAAYADMAALVEIAQIVDDWRSGPGLSGPAVAEIRALLAASPAPAPAAGVGLPQDVVRLVIAAREVAYSDPTPETIRELDKASEAFADRVPWEDEPKDDAAAVEPWFCGGCGETNPEKRCLGCMHGMEYPAPSPKAGETGNG